MVQVYKNREEVEVMAKKLYLVCNAHLDPIWQWEWEEGAAEALSTFRIAADFCEEYEHFVFCHNEALLYRWIEEYDPLLFQRIQMLILKLIRMKYIQKSK